MKIAVTFDNEMIFQHFGHTENFKIYNIENGKTIKTSILSTNGNAHGALADILKKENVDTLICGGIGTGAQNALSKINIKLYGGVTGNADKAVEDLLADKLSFNQNVECNHNEDHHHGNDHSCSCT